jgi:hypothetical protein
MRNVLRCSIALIISMFSINSFAQLGPSLGLGLEVGVPIGDFNITQKPGIGGSAKFAFGVGTGTALTLSAGYISFGGRDVGGGITQNFIPIKAGVRYKLGPVPFYLEPQLGYTSISASGGAGGTGGFTYAANAGFLFSKFDISARYEGVSRSGSSLAYMGIRAGFNIGL